MAKSTKKSPKKPARKSQGKKLARFPRLRAVTWLKLGAVASVLFLALLIYSDARVRATFDDLQWELPAKVYARPLVLASGVTLSAADLKRELHQLGYRRDPLLNAPGSYHEDGNRIGIFLREFSFPDGLRPAGRLQVTLQGEQVARVANMQGVALEEAQLEPAVIGGIYPRRHEDRLLVRLEETPQVLIDSLLQVEDREFYQHHGISLTGIGRALLANIKAGRAVQGGSTLTQQLVKNMLLTNQRSLWRKFQEAIMAVLMEVHYSKDAILEAYLNEVYLGQEGSRAIHGFGLAAFHYFNQPLAELSVPQIAMLVGLVKGPSYYDPWRHPERALQRRNVVLSELVEQDWLTLSQMQNMSREPLGLAKSSAVEGVYPAYLDLVRRQLQRDYRMEDLHSRGLRVFTFFDPNLQRRAEEAVTETVEGWGAQYKELQAAMVVTAVGSGNVLAVVGSREPRFAGFNRALDAVRPIGSLVKPAVYLAALSQPHRYTLASTIEDAPVRLQNPDGSLWQPQNFDKKAHGKVLLHTALAQSYNLATVNLGLALGIDEVVDTLQRLGVRRPLPKVPSLLLGAAELSPIEVAMMYQTIADGGVNRSLRAIYAVTDGQGNLLARYPQQPRQTLEAPAVHLVQAALIETVREGTGRGVYQSLPAAFRVAGKTGTSDDLRDSWFAGFAGDYVAVAWIGRDDNASTGLTGSSGALKVWRQFMRDVSREPMRFAPAEGVTYNWIDDATGLLSHSWCGNAHQLPFIAGSAPVRQGGNCEAELPTIWQRFRDVFN